MCVPFLMEIYTQVCSFLDRPKKPLATDNIKLCSKNTLLRARVCGCSIVVELWCFFDKTSPHLDLKDKFENQNASHGWRSSFLNFEASPFCVVNQRIS